MTARVRSAASAPTRLSASHGTLLHGDCLELVGTLEQSERFDLVYVDPPFNTGLSHGFRKGRGERARGERAYVDAWGGLDEFLAMLEPRLRAISKVMSER
ncbi:MAG TPA: hypothetical protein VF103_13735, partial [Polyangiaceae bacterium]